MTTEYLLDEIADLKHKLAIAESFPLKVRMECRKHLKSNDNPFVTMLHESANNTLDRTKVKK